MSARQPVYDMASGRWLAEVNRSIASRQWLQAPAAQRNYAGAAMVARKPGWVTSSMSANAEIHGSLDVLRARSRQLAKDSPHLRKFLGMVADNVVGPNGFVLQARVYDGANKPDSAANDAIERAWQRFCRRGVCEVSGKLSLLGVQHLLLKTAARDGEFLVRLRFGANARNPFGIALQVLDVDRIDTQHNAAADGTRNAIRMGVEIDADGRTVAYWLRTRHPGDPYASSAYGDARVRVPADEILHGFVADRPEQVRGVPWGHASIRTLDDLGGYKEAALFAARFGAEKMGFFTSEDGDALPLATDVEGGGDGAEGDERFVMDVDPGKLHVLPTGVGFTPFDTQYPSQMYGEFVQEAVRDIATGLCVAYHSLGNNLEGVSFSSIRSGTLEERDSWMVLQAWFVDEFLEPLFERWLPLALTMGQITLDNGSALPLRNLDKFSAHVWQPRRWEWVDPRADIEADLAAVRAGLKAPQDIAAKMGQDFEDVLQKTRQAMDLARRLGVPITWQTGGQQQPVAGAQPVPNSP